MKLKPRLITWWLGSLLLFFAIAYEAFISAGQFLEMNVNQPVRADLIVALGGDSGSRVHEAIDLYRRGYASRILLTGLEGGHPDTRTSYLNWRSQFLINGGVPRSALIFDVKSGNSWQEAANILQLMQDHGWKRVLVVSDPPHMRRLSWVWNKIFSGSGKEFRLITSPLFEWDSAHWWRNEVNAQFVIMEYIKLVYYWIVY